MTAALAIASIVIIIAGAIFLGRRMTKAGAVPRFDTPEAFARLLVAEMAMMHGKAVDNAREHQQIYLRFKPDIDRSRQMFMQRFPQNESAWYAALISVLGRGNPDALGADYPYARND